MTLTAIPPISGFGTCVTMAGMAYASVQPSESHSWTHVSWRLIQGWIIASGGLVLSSSISFIALRALLNRLHGHWSILTDIKNDRRFRALQQAVRERGLWMAVLARYQSSPCVYIVSATLSAPRILIHVFMGAKLYELIDSDVRAHQDTATKVRNVISIIIGLLLGVGSSWLIWKETSRILDLDSDEPLLEEGAEEWRTEHEEDQFVL
ncbi:TVP38 [Malassezia furfur]|nr:TVP38 [Malassezia furfur]